MKEIYKKIWNLAIPYLKKGVMKDFVIHTKGVVRAMEIILKKEQGDKDILIPAAILHDVGWYKVPRNIQKSKIEKEKWEASRLHIEYAPPVIRKILGNLNYEESKIEKIIDIVIAHKSPKPRECNMKLLIDADNLSDVFQKQFQSDIKSYNTIPKDMYRIRKANKFYTKTARKVFAEEMKKREKDFSFS